MIEQALAALLTADAGVAALAGDRVYPQRFPQAPAYPALIVTMVAGVSHYSMDGPSNLARARVQVDCYAQTHEAASRLKAAVMAALSGFRGSAGTPAIEIQGVFRESEYEPLADDLDRAGPRAFRKALDFTIWHEESS